MRVEAQNSAHVFYTAALFWARSSDLLFGPAHASVRLAVNSSNYVSASVFGSRER